MDLKEFDALLHDAEVKMKRLKALYEQWFQGIERVEPQVARKDLERLFVILNKDKPRNTAARFRLQQLVARYSIYTTLWGRVARQIEEGTYERDIRRAQRIRGIPAERAAPKAFELDLDEDVDLDDDLFGVDEIASVLGALDQAPPIAAAPKPALSAFSPFAMKKGAQTAKQPAAPAAPQSPAPKSPAPQHVAPQPAVAPVASAPTTSTFKKPVVATFGKPKVTTDSSGTRTAPSPAGAPRPVGRPPEAPASGARATPVVPAGHAPRPVVAIPSTARVPAPSPGAPPASAGRVPPPPRAHKPAEDPLKHLYDRYVDARRRNNERVDNVAYDKLAASVQQMASKLREKHGDKKIDFEVVVQNGKVGIKPKIG